MEILTDYSHFPTDWAKLEYESTLEQPYRVTTICWTHFSKDGTDDPRQVHKCVYKMTLREFLEEWMPNYKTRNEKVVSIEKI